MNDLTGICEYEYLSHTGAWVSSAYSEYIRYTGRLKKKTFSTIISVFQKTKQNYIKLSLFFATYVKV